MSYCQHCRIRLRAWELRCLYCRRSAMSWLHLSVIAAGAGTALVCLLRFF